MHTRAFLKATYTHCRNIFRPASYETLVKTTGQEGQDPDDYVLILEQRCARLMKSGEVSDDRFQDIILRGITSDRDTDVGLKGMQATIRRMDVDGLKRKNNTPECGGGGGGGGAEQLCRQYTNPLTSVMSIADTARIVATSRQTARG